MYRLSRGGRGAHQRDRSERASLANLASRGNWQSPQDVVPATEGRQRLIRHCDDYVVEPGGHRADHQSPRRRPGSRFVRPTAQQPSTDESAKHRSGLSTCAVAADLPRARTRVRFGRRQRPRWRPTPEPPGQLNADKPHYVKSTSLCSSDESRLPRPTRRCSSDVRRRKTASGTTPPPNVVELNKSVRPQRARVITDGTD